MAVKFDDKDIKYTKNFIDNEFYDSKSGKYYELYDFLTNKTYIKVTEGDKYDVDIAVTAARRAFDYESEWRSLDYLLRGRYLYRLVELMERDFEYLIWLESRTTGKTYEDVKYDVRRSIEYLRYYSGYTDEFYTKNDRTKFDYFEWTTYEPLGVIGLIGDHIDPLWTFIRQIVPVLVAGNTLVYKPSYKTPLTVLYLAKLISEAGFPKGVVNIVLGKGTTVGEAIGLHYDIKFITFAGRKEVGKLYYEYAAQSNFKDIHMYLVDKSPLFVLEDADIDHAAMIAYHASFFKDGKTRYLPVRVFVHDSVYDKFIKRSIELVQRRRLGNFFDKETRVGSFINEFYYKKFMDYVDKAKKDGAKLEYGGKRYGTTGWVVEPTIFSDVRDDLKFLMDYETYGPIQLITRLRSYDEIPTYLQKWGYDRTVGFVTNNFMKFKDFGLRFDNYLHWYNTWYDLKPYLKYLETRKLHFGDYIFVNTYERDVINYYLKKKVFDGLWDTKKYDYYWH